MPGRSRLYVAELAQYVVQRKNNRAVCFDADYAFYLQKLKGGGG